MKAIHRRYDDDVQAAIRKNADDQETIKLKLADLYESYFFISNSPWIVRFCFLGYYERKIAIWEFTLQHKKKEMKKLVHTKKII
ncbi:MAG TPA: hypothetical protein ENH43_00590 [Phycisphaerales bacterium]|nr:hypothetical protein [Phycisphaerales bacterium]